MQSFQKELSHIDTNTSARKMSNEAQNINTSPEQARKSNAMDSHLQLQAMAMRQSPTHA
jgi:hypothetical protein